jgi:hypothetical protein
MKIQSLKQKKYVHMAVPPETWQRLAKKNKKKIKPTMYDKQYVEGI